MMLSLCVFLGDILFLDSYFHKALQVVYGTYEDCPHKCSEVEMFWYVLALGVTSVDLGKYETARTICIKASTEQWELFLKFEKVVWYWLWWKGFFTYFIYLYFVFIFIYLSVCICLTVYLYICLSTNCISILFTASILFSFILQNLSCHRMKSFNIIFCNL